MTVKSFFLVLGLVLITAVGSFGQTANTGSIAGTVKDQSGAVIPDARVTVRESSTGVERTVTTNAAGAYRAPLLEPGVYTVHFVRDGFGTVDLQDVRVVITETTVADVAMKVGVAVQSVSVEAVAPILQTTEATTGRVIEEKTITELPLATRNFTQLLTLSSGAFAPIADNAAIGLNSQNISVNGARPTNNNLILNAVDANQIGLNNAANLPIPATDTIQEFKVQTSLYDASTGRGGGAAIAAVTKSGGSDYHGNLYEFFRNDALNANNFFFNATGTPRPVLKRNQFGGTFGGPLSVPGLYDGRKGSTFFFVSYQGSRETNGASLISSVSSASLPVGLTDNNRTAAGLSQAFPNEQPGQISQVAINLLNAHLPNGAFLIPSPQVQKTGINFTESIPAHFLENQFNVNLDHNFSASDKFSAKFFSINYPTQQEFLGFFDAADAANLPGFGGNLNQKNRVLSLVETHVFNGNLVNEARVGFTRVYADFNEAEPISLASVGITRFNQAQFPGIPSIQVLGQFNIGPLPIFDVLTGINNYQYSDTLSYVRGRHSLKFGVEFKREQENFNVDFFQRGVVLFLSFDDFLKGNPFLGVDGSGILNRNFRNFDAAGYVQDDFKMSPKLTLNFGLRYEIDGPPSDTEGRLATFDPQKYQAGNPPNGFVLAGNVAPQFQIPGVPRVSNTLLKTSDYNNFAPRVGFAYKPFEGHPLVVRGGYGIFYSRISNEAAVFSFTNPPFAELGEQFFPGSFSDPLPHLPLPSQFPIAPVIPGINSTGTGLTGAPISAFALDPNAVTPYVQQYNLTVQHEFAKDFVLEVGYVGSHGVKLLRRVGIAQSLLASPQNPVNGITTNTPDNADLRSPFPGLSPSGFVQFQTSGSSSYNSLQTSLTKRLGHGLQFLASYTFSKSIDDAASGSQLGDSRITSDGDQHNLRLNRAPSDFDRPHRFVTSFTYDLPAYKENAVLHGLTSNWELSGIFTAQSGTPLDIVDSLGGALFGGSNSSTGIISRASFVPGQTAGSAQGHGSIEGRLNQFFNTKAFEPAQGGLFGDLGRNILRGPNEKNVDFSVLRRFPVKWVERSSVEFRAEFFNVFNFVNFDNPVTNIQAGTFGQIQNTSTSARIIQFALKYNF
jgi:Carboxypeptidase regulatory-like domain/TonB dependent receptor-like, beta-barrel